jgi:hypothetical protein
MMCDTPLEYEFTREHRLETAYMHDVFLLE